MAQTEYPRLCELERDKTSMARMLGTIERREMNPPAAVTEWLQAQWLELAQESVSGWSAYESTKGRK